MKVTTGWVNKNMGIPKETIRYWDEHLKLIPKEHYQNKSNNKKYRNYDTEDLELLWTIKLLKELGCSYDTIKLLVKGNKLSIVDVLDECKTNLNNQIVQLEEELEKKRLLLELTKTIELTGAIPFPKEFGNVKFNDFLKESTNEFNIFKDNFFGRLFILVEKAKGDENNLTKEEIDEIEKITNSKKFNSLITFLVLLKILGRCITFGIEDIKIKFLVANLKAELKKIYEIDIAITDDMFPKLIKYMLDTIEYRHEIGEEDLISDMMFEERNFILEAFNANLNLSEKDEQSVEFVSYQNMFKNYLPINLEEKGLEEINDVINSLAHFDVKKILMMNILIGYLKDRFHLKVDSEEVQTILELIFKNFKNIYFHNEENEKALNYLLSEKGIEMFKDVIPTLSEDNIKFIKKALEIFKIQYIEKGEID